MSQYGNPEVGHITKAVPLGNGRSARLTLLEPRPMYDTVIRPTVYSFDQNFVEALGYDIDRLASQNAHVNHIAAAANLASSDVGVAAVAPAMNGYNVGTSLHSHYWTFVLNIDNDIATEHDVFRYGMASHRPVRRMITGYIINEPCTANNPNPNCEFHPTHHSAVGIDGMVDSNLQMHDVATINALIGTGVSQYLSTPYTAYASILTSNEYPGEYSPTYSPVGESILDPRHTQNRSVCTYTPVNSRQNQLLNIVDAVLSSSVNMADNVGAFDSNKFKHAYDAQDVGLSTEYISSDIAQCLSTYRPVTQLPKASIDYQAPFTFADLITIFPNIWDTTIVQRNDTQLGAGYGMTNVHAQNRLNVACQMVADAAHAIITDLGITYMNFTYDSNAPQNNNSMVNHSLMIVPGALEVGEYVGTVNGLDQNQSRILSNQFLMRLQREVLTTLNMIANDAVFVNVSAAHGGEVHVFMDLKAHGLKTDGTYVLYTSLGGNVSPIVGDNSVLQKNALEVNKTIDQVASIVSPHALSSVQY
jgi:hypothetical protein